MAKSLGVSRGSFYWHFKDLASYHARLLEHWRAITTDAVIRDIDAGYDDRHRLEELMLRAIQRGRQTRLDQAIRHWALFDKTVEASLADVDRMRMAYITSLLVAAGVSQKKAMLRSRLIYAASLGDPHIAAQAGPRFTDDDIRQLNTLFSET
ncbi:MAG: TetR/AcrR family transcriptional regulator [Pseudomonadota bacterium]